MIGDGHRIMNQNDGDPNAAPNPQQDAEVREEEGPAVIQEHNVPGVEGLIYPERVTFREALYPDAPDAWRHSFPITPQFEDELRRSRELLESPSPSSSEWMNVIRSLVNIIYENRDTFNAMYEAIRRQSVLLKNVCDAQARESNAFRGMDEGVRELYTRMEVAESVSSSANLDVASGVIQDLANRMSRFEEMNASEKCHAELYN